MRRVFISEELADRIRQDLRNRKITNLSHAEIGRLRGVPRETVSRISRGEWRARPKVAPPKTEAEWRAMPRAERMAIIANRAGNNAATAPRCTDHLIDHARLCDTNARIRAIMEAPR